MDIAIEQVRVSDVSAMASHTIREMDLGRSIGVIVMAIRKHDGHMLFNPPADTPVCSGDFLIVMGKQENLRSLESLLSEPRSPKSQVSGNRPSAG